MPMRIVLFIYTVLSGWTWVEGEAGVGILGRITAADIFGVFLIFVAIISLLLRGSRLVFPSHYYCYIPVFLVFLVSGFFSWDKSIALFELIIHFFIFSVSLALVNMSNMADEEEVKGYLVSVLYGSSLIALVGILHFFFFPSLFSGSQGGLSGTFRNTGQAGAYFGIFIALFAPAFMSRYISLNVGRALALIILVVALLLTFKRSFWVGTCSGLLISLFGCIYLRRVSMIKTALTTATISAVCGVFLVVIFFVAIEYVPGVQWRFERKMTGDVMEKFMDGFFDSNIDKSVTAFHSSPLIGIGLSNFRAQFGGRYEIHGTWLALLAYSGVAGVLAVMLFFFMFVRRLYLSSKKSVARETSDFIILLVFFFLGLLIAWLYTYPLRKRELWIYMAIVSILLVNVSSRCNRVADIE